MSKFKIIISFCLITVLFFVTYIFFQSTKNVTTFKRYTSPTYKINKSLIEKLYENDNILEDDIEKQIIKSVLDMIEYDKWNEFLDYIDMNIYFANLSHNPSEQLILSLNLSKDSGVVVIFDRIEDKYIFNSKIENLAPIENIKSIKHPVENIDFLAIYQIIDESLGAFFREQFVQVYKYAESDFNPVWRKTLFYEEVFNESWVNLESSETDWTMVIEETEIDFDFADSAQINTITSFKKYEAQSEDAPPKGDFFLKDEKSYTRSYYWSNKYNTFILGELTKDVFISNVAILDDIESREELLFSISNPYYKIATANGEFIYLPKSKFSKLFEDNLIK